MNAALRRHYDAIQQLAREEWPADETPADDTPDDVTGGAA